MVYPGLFKFTEKLYYTQCCKLGEKGSVDTSFAYQKLKERLHKAISVELRTSIKNTSWVAVDWGDSSEVTSCSHDPDFFMAVSGEVEGDKEIFPLSDGSNQRQLHVQIRSL